MKPQGFKTNNNNEKKTKQKYFLTLSNETLKGLMTCEQKFYIKRFYLLI